MTTPEKFRRRQQWELTAVLVILVGSLCYSIYDSNRDQDRRECMAESFQAASDVTKKRAAFVDRAAAIQLRIDNNQSAGLTAMASSTSTEEFIAARAEFKRQDKILARRLERVMKRRANTKIPDLPDGRCEDGKTTKQEAEEK